MVNYSYISTVHKPQQNAYIPIIHPDPADRVEWYEKYSMFYFATSYTKVCKC